MSRFQRQGSRWQPSSPGQPPAGQDPAPTPSAPPTPEAAATAKPELAAMIRLDSEQAAKAVGQAEGQLDINAQKLAELEKRIANLSEENEGLRKRVVELERTPEPPQPQEPNPHPQNPDPVTPAGEAPGIDIAGQPKGTILRVEKGQSVEAFRKEYNLDDAKFAEWLRDQFPTVSKENPDNFSDGSWAGHVASITATEPAPSQ